MLQEATEEQAMAALDQLGITSVHVAAATVDSSRFRELLAADPASGVKRDKYGWTPGHWATMANHADAVQRVLAVAPGLADHMFDSGGRIIIHWAAIFGHADIVRTLLDAAPDTASAVDADSNTPLHFAAGRGHLDVVQLLLEAAPATAAPAQPSGMAPLHLAAEGGHLHVVQRLLEAAPAAAAAVTLEGSSTPLHLAAVGGYLDVVQLLLEAAPATAAAQDALGRTPLHRASRGGYTRVIQLLLEAAPDVAAAVQTDGKTPFSVAELPHEDEDDWDFFGEADDDPEARIAAASALLAAGPAESVLADLCAAAPDIALRLFPDFVTSQAPLTDAQWALIPTPCPGLGRALPAALAHSTDQARQLVRHLPPEDAQRLRARPE